MFVNGLRDHLRVGLESQDGGNVDLAAALAGALRIETATLGAAQKKSYGVAALTYDQEGGQD